MLFIADYNGLRVLGRSEASLNLVANTLQRRFGNGLSVDCPVVRYVFGVPVLEPYMTVLVQGPLAHLSRVRNDIAQRRGRIARVSKRGNFVLKAEAPLAALLGCGEWLQELFGEDRDESYVGLWLSRYVAIDGHGPQAA